MSFMHSVVRGADALLSDAGGQSPARVSSYARSYGRAIRVLGTDQVTAIRYAREFVDRMGGGPRRSRRRQRNALRDLAHSLKRGGRRATTPVAGVAAGLIGGPVAGIAASAAVSRMVRG